MPTIMPEGENIRKAIKWISAERQESNRPFSVLIEEAALRFNLSPKEEEYLRIFYEQEGEKIVLK